MTTYKVYDEPRFDEKEWQLFVNNLTRKINAEWFRPNIKMRRQQLKIGAHLKAIAHAEVEQELGIRN